MLLRGIHFESNLFTRINRRRLRRKIEIISLLFTCVELQLQSSWPNIYSSLQTISFLCGKVFENENTRETSGELFEYVQCKERN